MLRSGRRQHPVRAKLLWYHGSVPMAYTEPDVAQQYTQTVMIGLHNPENLIRTG